MIEIITDIDAETRRINGSPLSWPIYGTFAHCTGRCGQGRTLCMTPEQCSGVYEADREPMLRRNAIISLACMLASAVFAVALIVWGVSRLTGA